MSLSSSTLLIFLFLIPGIVFRQVIYFSTIVKRPLSRGNAIHSVLSILTLSVLCQIAGTTVFVLVARLASWLFEYQYALGITDESGRLYVELGSTSYTPIDFLYQHWTIAFGYLAAVVVTTFAMAFGFAYGARSISPFGRMLFGPLAPILSNPVAPIVQCFVMTKITHGSSILVYAGHAVEIALKDGSNIDHVVLQDPDKFYFQFDDEAPRTTFGDSRPVSGLSLGGLLYISGEDISNVHFDHFYLSGWK